MKVNVTTPITNLDGTPVLSPATPESLAKIRFCEKCATLVSENLKGLDIRTVIVNALLNPNAKSDPTQKLTLGRLAEKVFASDSPSLAAEEVALIKAAVGEFYGPLIILRVFDAIDPPDKE